MKKIIRWLLVALFVYGVVLATLARTYCPFDPPSKGSPASIKVDGKVIELLIPPTNVGKIRRNTCRNYLRRNFREFYRWLGFGNITKEPEAGQWGFGFDTYLPDFSPDNLDGLRKPDKDYDEYLRQVSVDVFGYVPNPAERSVSYSRVMKQSVDNAAKNIGVRRFNLQARQLAPQYGLQRYGYSDVDMQQLYKHLGGNSGKRDLLYHYDEHTQMYTSVLICYREDVGGAILRPSCNHQFFIPSLQMRVDIVYASANLQHWSDIQNGVERLVTSFIVE